jgi:hypothetical protein
VERASERFGVENRRSFSRWTHFARAVDAAPARTSIAKSSRDAAIVAVMQAADHCLGHDAAVGDGLDRSR